MSEVGSKLIETPESRAASVAAIVRRVAESLPIAVLVSGTGTNLQALLDTVHGSEAQIVEFCQTNYDVSFPLSAKLEVNGAARHPLYAFLTAPENGFAGDIEWNFEKFLIGRDGKVLKRYPPPTKPQDSGLLQDISDAL